ncbi:MAG: ATP-binding cassette domain-containing protein [Intestinimonas sp.]
MTIPSGRTSAWGARRPPTQRWKPWQRPQGATALSAAWNTAIDTVVGGGGAHLSGGERQRIAIARAMLKDAPIVVLDEATAYIDPEKRGGGPAGREPSWWRERPSLVIAHRLSAPSPDADQIVVSERAAVCQRCGHPRGTSEFTARLYQEMWRAHMGAKEGEAGMIEVFEKIWRLCRKRNRAISRKSVISGLLLRGVPYVPGRGHLLWWSWPWLGGSTDSAPAWQALGLLLAAAFMGRAVPQPLQPSSSRPTPATSWWRIKRIAIGDKLEAGPYGLFQRPEPGGTHRHLPPPF